MTDEKQKPKKKRRKPPSTPAKKAMREKRFVEEFIIDLNAKRAALRAGWSKGCAHQAGSILLSKKHIQEMVQEKFQERAARTEVTADKVIYELAMIAFSDISNYSVSSTGSLVLRDPVLHDHTRAVKSVKQKYHYGDEGEVIGGQTEIVLWDKTRALEMLGRHLAMFVDRREHTGKDGGPIKTEGILTSDMAEQIKCKIFGIEEDK